MGDIQGPTTKILGAILAILFISLGLELIRDPFVDIVTKDYSQTTSVTADSSGAGTLTLSHSHFFTDTERMSVMGATDGDVTSGTTVGSDRKALSLTGLAASSSQSVTVSSLQDKGGTIDALWKTLPFFMLMGVVSAIIGLSVAGGTSLGSSALHTRILTGVIVLVIGGILTSVQGSFVESARTAYSNAPDFTGITLGLPLLDLAYVLVLLGLTFGMFGGGDLVGRASRAIGQAKPKPTMKQGG